MMLSYRITGMIISGTQTILKNRKRKQVLKKQAQKNQVSSTFSTNNTSNNSFKSNTSKDTGVYTQGSQKSMYNDDMSVHTHGRQKSIDSGTSSYSDSYYTSSSVSSESRFRDDASTTSSNGHSAIGNISDTSDICEYLKNREIKKNKEKNDIFSVASSTDDIQTAQSSFKENISSKNSSQDATPIILNLINKLQEVKEVNKEENPVTKKQQHETPKQYEIFLNDDDTVSVLSSHSQNFPEISEKSDRTNMFNNNIDLNNNRDFKNIPQNIKGRTAQLGRFIQKNVLNSPLRDVTPIQSIKKNWNAFQKNKIKRQEEQAIDQFDNLSKQFSDTYFQKQKEILDEKQFDNLSKQFSNTYFQKQKEILDKKQKDISKSIEKIKYIRAERLNNLIAPNTTQLSSVIEKNILNSPLRNVTPIQSIKKTLIFFQRKSIDRKKEQVKKQFRDLSKKLLVITNTDLSQSPSSKNYFQTKEESFTNKKNKLNQSIKETKNNREKRLTDLKKSDYKIGDKNIGNKLRTFQLNDTDTLNIIKNYIQNTDTLDHTAFETGALKKLFTVVDDMYKDKIIDTLLTKIKLNKKLNDLQKDTQIYKLHKELGINQEAIELIKNEKLLNFVQDSFQHK